MNNHAQLKNKALEWLAKDVFPLWGTHGIDPENGGFVECLSLTGDPQTNARRGMVQARQIYSFVEGAHLGILPMEQVRKIVERAIEYFITHYSLPNGGFIHSIDVDGEPADPRADLYTQAFGLFGLASAYEILKDPLLKMRALKLLEYLKNERALKAGGYSELVENKVVYAANPHMHLYEAALAWMRVDFSPQWKDFATEIDQMCRLKFIDAESGGLCEIFDSEWRPLRDEKGFFWEPGHHSEWAWLMVQYAELTKKPVDQIPFQLFRTAEETGVDHKTGFAFDEVWSSGSVKKSSSRFWPQSERIKAAVSLGLHAPEVEKVPFAKAADQALTVLFTFFANIKPGLWYDTRANGQYAQQPAKASSLYHIINAISEYAQKRSRIA